MNANELPQTDSYRAARKRRGRSPQPLKPGQRRSWLPALAVGASLIILVLAVTMPLWLPGAVRRVIPDRYIMAYAPAPLQAMIFNIDPGQVLPTPDVPADPDQLLQAPAAVSPGEATPWPTLAAVVPAVTETSQPAPEPTATAGAGQAAAFATATPAPVVIPEEHLLTNVAQVPQGYNKCGPATLTSYLGFYNSSLTQNDISNAVKPHPEDSNVRPDELADYARSQGYGAIERINGDLDLLKQLIAAGYPVMIERGFDELPDEGWMGHYMLMIGYSDVTGEFTAMDSYWGTNRRHDDPSFPVDQWEYGRFDALWQDFNRAYIVVYNPGQEAEVASIIGPDMDESTMYAKALNRTLAEAEQNPADPFAWFNLGEVYNALGQYGDAAAAFDMARQIGTPWRTMWYRFGPYEAYYQTGRYDDVISLAQATTDPTNYPESEEAFLYLGRVYAARGDARTARSMYNKALQYNPNYSAAQEALAALGEG